MESKKINQLATEMSPAATDLTIIGDPITGVSKKITLEQIASLFAGSVSFYANLAAFPPTGVIDTIYCAKDTNKLYLWSGSAYVQTFPSQALLDTYQLRSEKGASNGYASLDSAGKVPVSQLPSSIMEYKGMWSAATNTPTLANGTGDTGDVYICNAAGSVNFGAGAITFAVGDYVIYSGSIWQRSSGAVGTVTSVGLSTNGNSITIGSSPVTTSGTITANFVGDGTQYINGAGNLTTFPTLLSSDNLVKLVRNQSGATITAGTVIYISGATGNKPLIAKALATGDATSAQTYGLLQTDIANNADGYVVVIGNVNNLDTSAFTEGQQLYLSGTTAGTYTTTKPYAPIHLVYVGIVLRAHPTMGIIGVKIQNGYEMDELHNVAAQSPNNGDILQYVTSTNLWTKTAGTTTNIAEGTNLYYTDVRARAAISVTLPLLYNSSTGVLNINKASTTVSGWLSYDDFNTFNNKQAALSGTGFVKISGTTISYDNSTYLTGNQTITLNGDVSGSGTTAITTTIGALKVTNAMLAGSIDLTSKVTGILPIANGGTGSSTKNFVDLTSNQSISGTKTFSVGTKYDGGILLNDSSGFGWVSGYIGLAATNYLSNKGLIVNFGSYLFNLYFNATSSYSYTFPNATGTLALTSDLTGGTVTSVAALTIGTSGTDLSSSVANSTTTPVITLNVPTASATNRGALSSADWTTFNNKQKAFTVVNPLTYNTTTNELNINKSSSTVSGWLSYDDWNTFNSKQGAITLTTTGTSGAATFSSNTLNIPQYQGVLTNPVTGTGTTNYLPKFTGASTIGNSQIFDNGTSVGINQPSPTRTLDILGASGIGTVLKLQGASGTTTYLQLAYNGATNAQSGYIGYNSSSQMQFFTNDTVALTIDSNRNLGLGVTPTGKLHIALPTYSNEDTDSQQAIFGVASGYGVRIGYNEAGNYGVINSLKPAVAWGNLVFQSGGGNVLIGTTTNAGYKLDVNGTGRFVGNLTVAKSDASNDILLKVQQTANFTAAGLAIVANNDGGAGYNFIYSATNAGSEHWKIFGNGTANTLAIQTGGTTRLTIASTGAATFSSSVTANSTSGISGSFVSNTFFGSIDLENTGGTATGKWNLQAVSGAQIGGSAGSSFGIYSYGASAYRMFINSSGNVLIGTTTDSGYKLDVNGTGRFSDVLSVFVSGNDTRLANFSTSTYGSARGLRINSYTSSNGGQDCGVEFDSGVGGYGGFKLSNSGTPMLTLIASGAATFSSTTRVNGGTSTIYSSSEARLNLNTAPDGESTTGWLYSNNDVTLGSSGIVNIQALTTTVLSVLDFRNIANNTATGTGGNVYIGTSVAQGINIGAGLSLGGWTTSTGGASAFARLVGRKENATSGNTAGYLSFETANASPNQTSEKMRIASTGELIVNGNSAPYSATGRGNVNINGATGSDAMLSFTNNNSAKGYLLHNGSALYIQNSTTSPIYITANTNGVYLANGATSWTANSDIRLKNINSNLTNVIDKLMTLKAVNFSWKSDETNKENLGLIAQDVEKVFPQVIDRSILNSSIDNPISDKTEYLGVRYQELVPVLIAAIQEQQKEINELKQLINK
jgi:hypothetical protein